ncbi:MAG TPA: DUF1298 domain-containing protein [Actinomycetales bacterium]|nr:DUF1298 domain-containing protein [Actinomycetales bacterium]
MVRTDRVKIPLRDQLWLHMDRPDNLMYINSLVWFDEVPDWDRVIETIARRMIEQYPVFTRVPVREGRTWYWQDHPDFDLADHITYHRLPGTGDRAEAEAHISERISVPMPRDRPLWEVEFIEGYRGHDGDDGTEGALLLFRVQHGVVDGVRLTQLILSLCDHDDDSVPEPVGRAGLAPEEGGLISTLGHAGLEVARDSFGIAKDAARATITWPWTLAKVAGDVVAPGRQFRRVPTRAVESLTGVVSPTNHSANTFRSVFRLIMEPRAPELSWSGRAHAQKKVSWVSGLDLEGVKRIARAHESTVTAVILAAVSMGLTEYLRRHGDEPVADISLMVPISLAPIEVEPSSELGNHVTLIIMRLPLGVADPDRLLGQVTETMTRVRYSYEPHVTFTTMMGVAAAPRPVATAIIDFFANKTVGQLTSVPGPRTTVSLAGTPVAGMLGWVPMSGNQALGICIFSYDGQVSLGFATDAQLVPDPAQMAVIVGEQFANFAGWSEDVAPDGA